MNARIPGALVAGFEARIGSLTLPDPDDRHVLAAAIHCNASVIVTANLKDFPATARRGLTVLTPNEFLGLYNKETRSPPKR